MQTCLDLGNTPVEWWGRRADIRSAWLHLLGPFPGRCDLEPYLLEETEHLTHIRRRIKYCSEDALGGIWTEAYLLIPKPMQENIPAVVVFHPTCGESIDEPVGLAGFPSRHTALHLVERGYVVLCPQNYLWNYRGDVSLYAEGSDDLDPSAAASIAQRSLSDHPGWTGMGKMTWDGIRAIDYLDTLEFVDKDRIGCFGFSLGGKQAIYVPAFDERVRVSVSTEGGISLAFSNWDAPWYLGERIRAGGFDKDHEELLALIAPRAFLLMGSEGGVTEDDGKYTEGYDGERSRSFIEAVRPLYRMLGAEGHISIFCHSCGHSIPAVAREAAYEWLDRFLRDNCERRSYEI